MATIDELDSRLRFVEADVASEKDFARATLQQSVRNSALLNTLRTRIDELGADAVTANAQLRTHSTLLPVLQQDVTALRQDVTALRRGQEELHTRLDRIETRFDQRFDALERNVAAILAAVAPGGQAPA